MVLEQDKIYNGKELAEWFQISYSTFRNTKKKRLEELKEYAIFKEVGTKIQILKVYSDTYVNKRGTGYKIVYKLVEETWAENGYDTCAHIKELIKNHEELSHLSEFTIYTYIRRAHIEMYGHPAKRDSRGCKGFCYFKWGKRDKTDFKKPVYFSEEEEKYFNSLIAEVYSSNPKEVAEQEAVYQAFQNQEITKEDYDTFLESCQESRHEKWMHIEEAMFKKYGIVLIKATQDEFLAF